MLYLFLRSGEGRLSGKSRREKLILSERYGYRMQNILQGGDVRVSILQDICFSGSGLPVFRIPEAIPPRREDASLCRARLRRGRWEAFRLSGTAPAGDRIREGRWFPPHLLCEAPGQ